MFDFSRGDWVVPRDLAPLFRATFEDIASAGNAWTGTDRIAIADVARHRSQASGSDVLPKAAIDAAMLIATQPSGSTESFVHEAIAALGEIEYVELVGVTAAITAIDTVTALLGLGHETLPEPRPGEPTPPPHDRRCKRRSAWVAMNGPANPRHALTAAPRAQATVNRLFDGLFAPLNASDRSKAQDRLTREQRELVALTVSHSNECFW
ncbi:MAG: hypothetical protein ABFR53_04090 [Actinomycetota bacterium]